MTQLTDYIYNGRLYLTLSVDNVDESINKKSADHLLSQVDLFDADTKDFYPADAEDDAVFTDINPETGKAEFDGALDTTINVTAETEAEAEALATAALKNIVAVNVATGERFPLDTVDGVDLIHSHASDMRSIEAFNRQCAKNGDT